MPTDGKFGFKVVVAGRELPEYAHPKEPERVLIESALWTPVTYWEESEEFCDYSETVEKQKWPRTPYEIKVFTEPDCIQSWYYVYVDGIRVKSIILDRGESRLVKGFQEEDGGYSEFVFTLPRFARHEKDRVEKERASKIGTIEIVRYEAIYVRTETREHKKSKECDFVSANKKDCKAVTGMEYGMTTTRKGRWIRTTPYDRPPSLPKPHKKNRMTEVEIWDRGLELGRLKVEYHMTLTLADWGVKIQRPSWPEFDAGSVDLSSEQDKC